MTTPEQARREVAPRETEAFDRGVEAAAETAAVAAQQREEAEATANARKGSPWPSQRQELP